VRYITIVRPSLAVLVAAIVIGGSTVRAWTVPAEPARQTRPADESAKEVLAARTLLSAGRSLEAAAQADQVLKRQPANRDAADVKVSALVALQRLDEALGAYDAFVTASRKTDAAMLSTIGRAHLRRIARQATSDLPLMAGALERLARDGDAVSLETLKKAAAGGSTATVEAMAPLVSLVRLGDRDAEQRLGRALVSAPPESKAMLIRVLQDAGARTQAPSVAELLSDADSVVRCAAALAIGVFQYAKAAPQLQTMYGQDLPLVKMYTAAALKRLGQSTPEIDTYLAGMVTRGVPEVQVAVADAYQGASASLWMPAIKPLLSDRNELIRVRAAEVLACCDPTAARAGLVAALGSPVLPLRIEAARALEAKGLAEVADARKMLGDAFDGVRLHGAGASVALATAPRK